MSATTGPDTITGSSGNDNLDGLAGADIISGLAGNDTLIGGDGNDTLSGGNDDTLTVGADTDYFVFSFSFNLLFNSDVITDFSVATDTIVLGGSLFTAFSAGGVLLSNRLRLGPAAADADDYVIYDASTGKLY